MEIFGQALNILGSLAFLSVISKPYYTNDGFAYLLEQHGLVFGPDTWGSYLANATSEQSNLIINPLHIVLGGHIENESLLDSNNTAWLWSKHINDGEVNYLRSYSKWIYPALTGTQELAFSLRVLLYCLAPTLLCAEWLYQSRFARNT